MLGRAVVTGRGSFSGTGQHHGKYLSTTARLLCPYVNTQQQQEKQQQHRDHSGEDLGSWVLRLGAAVPAVHGLCGPDGFNMGPHCCRWS